MGRKKGSKNGVYKYVVCKQCKREFRAYFSKLIFCSHKCFTDNRKKENDEFGICGQCKNKFLQRAPCGSSNKSKRFCSRSCAMRFTGHTRKQAIRTLEWRKHIGDAQRGEKAHNWQGGKTPINKIIRRSIEFKQWREKVFERDNFTCQECSIRGGILHPHHLMSFSKFPLLRLEVSNGITLCESCHRKTNNFGNKALKVGIYL